MPTCGVGVYDVVARGRERRVKQGRQRHRDHVLLSQGVIPPVDYGVVGLHDESDETEAGVEEGIYNAIKHGSKRW